MYQIKNVNTRTKRTDLLFLLIKLVLWRSGCRCLCLSSILKVRLLSQILMFLDFELTSGVF